MTTSTQPYWLTQVLNAGLATVPVGYAFNAKTALQLNQTVAKTTMLQKAMQGFSLAPISAFIVGTQVWTQQWVQQQCTNRGMNEKKAAVASTIAVAAVTPFPLAVFNGRTMGYGAWESLKRFTSLQYAAVTAREVAFLGSLVFSRPLSEKAQEKWGKGISVASATTFATVSFGSLCGQVPDSIFTQLQAKRPINPSILLKGTAYRTWANAGFATVYEILNHLAGELCQHK